MKKIISLALIVCMLLSIALPLSVSAASSAPAIDKAAAEAYWTDATNGQFIKNASATVYEISTAEQLLGLSLAIVALKLVECMNDVIRLLVFH